MAVKKKAAKKKVAKKAPAAKPAVKAITTKQTKTQIIAAISESIDIREQHLPPARGDQHLAGPGHVAVGGLAHPFVRKGQQGGFR